MILSRCTGVQGYRFTGVHVYMCTGVHVYRGTGVQWYRCTGVQVYTYIYKHIKESGFSTITMTIYQIPQSRRIFN